MDFSDIEYMLIRYAMVAMELVDIAEVLLGEGYTEEEIASLMEECGLYK